MFREKDPRIRKREKTPSRNLRRASLLGLLAYLSGTDAKFGALELRSSRRFFEA